MAPTRAWRQLLLGLAILVVYSGSFTLPLVLDDRVTILENPSLRPWWSPAVVLFPARELPVAGRPLANASFALNAAGTSGGTSRYHVVNVALHIACALTLFGLVKRTLRLARVAAVTPSAPSIADDVAMAVAALWALHPLNSEVVNYLTQRTESMAALALLLMLYALLRSLDSARPVAWHATMVVVAFAGMASKESMVVAPLLLFIFDIVFVTGGWRQTLERRWHLFVAVCSSWVLLAALVAGSPRGLSAGFAAGVSAWTYLLNQSRMLVHYGSLFVWPTGFVINYGVPASLRVTDVLLPGALVLAFVTLTAVSLWRRPMMGFLGLWCVVTLAPTSSFIPIATEVGAERRMYLPSMALCALVLLAGLMRWPRTDHQPAPATSWRWLAGALAVTLAVLTVSRTAEYRSSLRLAQTTAERWPSPTADLMLGTELAAAGDRAAALVHMRQAAATLPRAHYHLGVELFNEGDLELAAKELSEFIHLEPGVIEAVPSRVLAGRAYAGLGRWPEAVAQFEQARLMAPSSPEISGLLAGAYLNAGQQDQAITSYQTYLLARPQDARAWGDLGTALVARERLSDAVSAFRRAAAITPESADARRNLATALYDSRDARAALPEADAAARLRPDDPLVFDLLGRIHAVLGRIEEAEADFQHGLALAPTNSLLVEDAARLASVRRQAEASSAR